MKSTTKQIKLDWSRLIGFNQVRSAKAENDTVRAKAAMAAKIGSKVGSPPANPN